MRSLLEAAKSLLWKVNHNTCKPDGSDSHPSKIDRTDATVRELQQAVDAEIAAEKNYGDRALALNKALTDIMLWWTSHTAPKGGDDNMPADLFEAAWIAIADHGEWTNEERMDHGLPIRGTLHCPACSHRLGGIIVMGEFGGTCDTCGHEVSL